MLQPVKVPDVIDALQMAADETSYYLDKRTGEIGMITNEIWRAVEDDDPVEDYPEWQRELILKAKEICVETNEVDEANDDNGRNARGPINSARARPCKMH
jgi:hypothetical protein